MEFDKNKKYRNAPLVVFAGRPNVGKSTLFNRLLRTRQAITDPTPGVTRDALTKDAFLLGKPVRLVDTGGFKLSGTGLDSLVVEKTLETLKSADLIVLMFEAGIITPEDEEFIDLLRKQQDKVLAVVNKTEGGRLANEAYNLLTYGFKNILMVSAEHGDHIGELEEHIVRALDFSRVEEASENREIRIALLGKPNTGKSTLSNMLTASEASIVSPVPGTTRDVVEGAFVFKNRRFVILDTAGIRRKSKVTENIEYYSVNRAIKALDEADLVFLLIDAVEGLADQDKKIAALAHAKGRGIIFVLNKWDLIEKESQNMKNKFEAVCDRIHFLFGQMDYAPIVPLCSLDGQGTDKLLNAAIRLNGQLHRKIDTPALNQALARWLEENPPPQGPQTRFKVKYAVQVSENPVKFIFFVSRLQAVKEAYVSYIRNKIRKDLGFAEIPIEIELRSSREKKEKT